MKSHAQQLLQTYSRAIERLAIPRHRIGLNVFRVFAGAIILSQYLLNYAQRNYLFGPNGIYSFDMFSAGRDVFSLYHLSGHPLVFEGLFHASIAVTIAWMFGFKTRWLTPLTYLLWFSLRQTNVLLWDGGDNLMQLILIYACFADLSPMKRTEAVRDDSPPSLWSSISGLFHNAAVLACALQICFVYGVSGLAKVQGETWQNGTALYYALWPEQFRFPGVSNLLFEDAALLAVATHATVFFQIAFPFMFCLNRYTRHAAVLVAIIFHLGIAGFMGLFTFAGFMIAAELILISDEAYVRTARWAKTAYRRFSSRRPHAAFRAAEPLAKASL